ncbi:epithelial-stromal interaction protein 1 [Centroberyx gerrardi]|uniref:epithelial-stromal interaction protein 1 n=1 Tax=Centroberyx gerrardi TaxID=166262 RepID=UPI003AAE034B
MDPYHNTRSHLNNRRNNVGTNNNIGTQNVSGHDNLPENPAGHAPDSGNPATDKETQPQHSDGFSMIAPNESRRSKLTMMAQKEEQDLQRWREAHRPPTVHLNPEKLGGNVSLLEARERQLTELRHSKLQKKLKKEEMDRKRRQEEEEELQKMKDKQREKAERLEERRRREEQRRREQLTQDHLRTTETFLQRFEPAGPAPVASGSATHTSSWHPVHQYRDRQREEENSALQLMKEEQRRKSEALEKKQREKEEERKRDAQLDHRRVNSAFLDKLERQGTSSGREAEREGGWEAELPSFAFEDFRQQLSQSPEPQDPLTHLKPGLEHSSSGWAEEADPDPDSEWAVMKLENRFPYCSRAFLQDILTQCSGDYQQAYTLLSDTLS